MTMPVDDLWYSIRRRGPNGERIPTARHGRGKRWRVRWTDDQGQPRTQAFDRRADAERHDALMRASVHRGEYIDPVGARTKVAAYAVEWRRQQLWDPATAERVERAFRLHIDPIVGSLQLGQVRTSHIKAWVKDRAAVLAPTTMKVVYGYLVALFRSAVADRLIGASPCSKSVTLPEIERTELFIPSVEQIDAICEALPARYAAQPQFAAATGLRQGEVWGLELDRHVDLKRRVVVVQQQLKVTDKRHRPYLAPPKTALSRRTVELSEVAVEALTRHIEQFPPAEVEIEDETDLRKPVRRKARLIFTGAKGQPISRHSWSHIWAPARARAGLPLEFDYHSLRDFFATALIFGGASVKTVQMALGHSTPTTTLNAYVGLWPDAVDTTRALVDAAFGSDRRQLPEAVD